MTRPPQRLRRGRSTSFTRGAGAAALGLPGLLVLTELACATAPTPLFSDGACVAGGCASTVAASSSSTSGVACTVDTACAVSWKTDIFAGILDGPAGCTAMQCHGGVSPGAGITLATGDPSGAYVALTGYTLLPSPGPAKPYIVPCSPSASGFPCNMLVGAGTGGGGAGGGGGGGGAAFGTCGNVMPLVLGGETPLTEAQVTSIADWITCGAPDN